MANHDISLSLEEFEQAFKENPQYKRLYLGCYIVRCEDDEGVFRFYDDKYIITHYVFIHGALKKFSMAVGYDGTDYCCIDFYYQIVDDDKIDSFKEFSGPLNFFITKNPVDKALSVAEYYIQFSSMLPDSDDLIRVDDVRFKTMLHDWLIKTEYYKTK